MSKTNIVDLFGDSHSVRQEASKDQDSDAPVAPQPSLHSSKEIFERLNPYFQRILVDLATSFESFTVPDELYAKIAEAYNIKGRADVFSIELLLTISKLQPLLAKKLNVKWSTIEKDIIRPLIRKHRADHYSASQFTLENVPQGQWFYGDEPISSGMDILLAARRMNCEITYDEWFDVCRISYKGETLPSMKLDDIHYLLTKEFTYHFKFRIEKRHTMDALGVLRRDPSSVFNSRLDWLDSFAAHYDPNFEWQRECVEILACKIDAYHSEVARALFISPVERSYRPGCILQHMIILDDPKGDMGKSTFCRILAGNPTLGHGHTRYFTDKNVFAIKNDVTRYSETKGKAVHEYAELARLSQMNLEHLKNDISSTVESYRPLWSQDLYERPRWFYSIGTTNKSQYNYDIVNRRYFGMKVALEGRMIDNQRFITNYNKIMGSLVWNIKNGMSGAISKDVAEEARYQQDIRIAETDLMIILKQIIAFCHCYEGTVPGNVQQTRIIEHYQIGYKETRGADNKVINRTYLVSLTALSRFATEYVNYRKRKDIPIDLQSIKTDILKLMVDIDVPADPNGDEIEDISDYKGNKDDIIYSQHHFKWKPLDKVTWVPTLKCAIRGYYLVIDAPHIAKIEALAMSYLLDLHDFIGQNFKNFI